MGLLSFLGRLLFASFFIISAWQMYDEFGVDGGPTGKVFAARLAALQHYLAPKSGDTPTIYVRQLVVASLSLKGLGGLLFIFSSRIGAFVLMFELAFTTPILYNFYSHDIEDPKFMVLLNEFIRGVALFGALLYFIGMKNSIPRRQIRKKTPRPKTA